MAVQADYNSIAQQIYIAYFGRPADYTGLNNMTASLLAANVPVTGVAAADTTAFVNAYSTNTTIKGIIDNFGTSTESLSYFGTGTNEAFVNAIYLQILGRSPLLTGLSFWSSALSTGAMTRGEAALRIMEGALNNTSAQGVIDAAGIANKTTAATSFTNGMTTTADVLGYQGTAAAATARTWLSTVTDDAATLTTATSTVATTITAINTATTTTAAVGTTYSLTTGSDNFTGGSGDDTFVGILSGALATGSTVQPGDQITGGAGTDTFNINISGDNGGAFTLASVTSSGVEKVLVSNYDSNVAASTIDMSTMTGVTHLGTTGSGTNGDTIFTNVKAIAAAQASGAGDLTVTYASTVVSGTTDTQALTVDNFTGSAIFTEVETLSLTASGTKSTIVGLNTDGGTQDTKTLNIAAAVELEITADLNTSNTALTKIDASASTAAVTLTTADTGTTSITLGSGDDVLIRNLNAAADTVAGGAGTDTLQVTTGAGVTSATLANYSGFETLEVTGGNGQTINLSGVTQFTTLVNSDTATGTTTFSNAGATTALAITVANGTDENTTLTLAANTAADSINVNIGPAGTSTTAVAMGTLTLANHETINIASAGANNSIAVLTSASATKLVATGAKGLTVTAFTGSTSLKTIDASAMTGAFIMGATIGTTADTITGGSGNDTLIGGTGNDVIVGGAGNDAIQLSQTAAATGTDNLSGGDGDDTFIFTNTTFTDDLTSADSIVGGAGTDSLQFGLGTAGSATIDLTTAGLLTGVSGIEKLILADTNTNQTLTINDNIVGLAGNSLLISVTQAGAGTGQVVVNNTLSSTATVTTTYDATTGYLLYTLGNSIDKATGGASTDVFTVASTTYLAATDLIAGGAGADTLLFTSTTAAQAVTAAQLAGISAVETISVVTGTTNAFTITLSDAVVAANTDGTNFTVTRGSDTSTGTLKVDGSAVTTYALTLTGDAGADTLIGGSGADTISGGLLADSLTGGGGNDTFQYVGNETGVDTITDFNFGTSSTSVDVFKTTAVGGTIGTAGVSKASAGALTAVTIYVLDTLTYADLTALNTAVTTGGGQVQADTNSHLIVWQDTLGNVHITADNNGATTAGQTDLAKLSGVTVVGVAALIDAGDFSFA